MGQWTSLIQSPFIPFFPPTKIFPFWIFIGMIIKKMNLKQCQSCSSLGRATWLARNWMRCWKRVISRRNSSSISPEKLGDKQHFHPPKNVIFPSVSISDHSEVARAAFHKEIREILEGKFPSDSDSHCQEPSNPSVAGHRQKSWTKAVSVFLALGKPPRHHPGLPSTADPLNQNSPVWSFCLLFFPMTIPPKILRCFLGRRPDWQKFNVLDVHPMDVCGWQAPLDPPCLSATIGSGLIPNHGKSLLGPVEPHREHHSMWDLSSHPLPLL